MDFASLSRSLGARRLSFSGEYVPSDGTAPEAGGASGFSSVSIDSRTVKPGALFVALAGEKSDGHGFVEAAFKKGAAGAMVDSAKLEKFRLAELAKSMDRDLLAVDNTLLGLQQSARLYLEKFPRLVKVGITGSSGKTTVKEIAAAIIGAEKNTVMNSGNLNSETGLPLSVFEVRAGHEVGIFEMGMNRRGEIAELAAVLKPNIALITNIGSAHIGIIGSKGAIAEEKKNIFSCFTGSETALIPDGDEYSGFLARGVKGRVVFYGESSFKELGGTRSLGLAGTEIRWNGDAVRFALPGRHNLADAMAALAIAREIPAGSGAVKRGLEGVKPLFGRSEILEGRVTLIRDCYNANPESVEQALDFCDSLDWPGRRIYVIGDMLELGNNSREAHERVGRLLAASKADMVFLYGKETAAALNAAAGAPVFRHYTKMPELSGALDARIRRGDLVLLKASRGCALEQLTDTLLGAAGEDVPAGGAAAPDKGGLG
ncbi:MAG: UDP-N-acetylmuramoyl-tripeptide--D-alanyl-D-alanine ligase [Treponema sp.]|jgi:UDP-N-acetylmuramoyl-tripeptide--D-alanyl-D-alanine ligase|nr:UDP-N-acetylmuramoyl-tripeptide--D-alanyl-D-alanine ligase [Treponema sp.]